MKTPQQIQAEDEKLFEGLDDRLRAEPVSLDQADQRVHDLLQRHLSLWRERGGKGAITYVVDRSLPPETVIKVEGSTITLSLDAYEALERDARRKLRFGDPFLKAKRTGTPYRGS